MKRMALALVSACLLLMFSSAYSQVADHRPLQFQSAAEEARFGDITHELRCVMCQNQSIADSEAQIAVDLRREILLLMRQGRSDAQIRTYLVERYGQFVLSRPGIAPATWLLWFGPLLAIIAGGAVVWRIVRSRAAAPHSASDDIGEW